MDITFEDIASNSFVISVDNNRLSKFYKVFSAMGWSDHLPEHVEGVIELNKLSPKGCTLAHLKVIELAKERNLPFCVIFEDDAYPCYDFIDNMIQSFKELPDDARALLLGYMLRCNDINLINAKSKVCPLNRRSYVGSHAYVVFRNTYDFLIDLLRNGMVADATVNKINNTFLCSKTLFIQYSINGMHFRWGYWHNLQKFNKPPEGFPEYEDLINKEKKDEIL